MKWLRRLRWLLPLALLTVIVPLAAQMMLSEEDTQTVFSPDVIEVLDSIYATGQARGNRMDVFSKVGDSITVSLAFFVPFGEGNYRLGEDYAYLQSAIDFYSVNLARTGNSFINESLAAGVGWSAAAVLDKEFADTTLCQTGEIPLVCEYRLTRPAVALIMFGTNDVGYTDPADYRRNMEAIVDISMKMGVIPVVSTIPNRAGLEGKVALYNAILLDMTTEKHLPLWDYAAALQSLPNSGLGNDGIHPSAPSWNYRATGDFSPHMLRFGYTIRNLTGLQMLYRLWEYLQTK